MDGIDLTGNTGWSTSGAGWKYISRTFRSEKSAECWTATEQKTDPKPDVKETAAPVVLEKKNPETIQKKIRKFRIVISSSCGRSV